MSDFATPTPACRLSPAASRSDLGGTGGSLLVRHLTTLDELQALRPVWNGLLEQCGYRDVFMTHAWAVAWWMHFGEGRRLCVDVVYDHETPVGLAPLMISRESYGGLPARILGFMTNNHTSRSAFLIPRRRAAVLRALAAGWRARARDWDVLRLLNLPQRSDQMTDLAAALRAEKLLVYGPDRNNQLFYAAATASFQDYLAAQGRKFRRNLHHARNSLGKAGRVTYETITDRSQIETGMACFFAIDEHSHKQGVEHAIYTRNEKAFCTSLCRELDAAPNSGFELWILRLDDRPICGLLVLLHEHKSVLLVTYYDERLRGLQPGRNLFAAVMESHCDGGRVDEVDFNGNSTYVQTWTSQSDLFDGISACNLRPYSLVVGSAKTVKRLAMPYRERAAAYFRRKRTPVSQAPDDGQADRGATP